MVFVLGLGWLACGGEVKPVVVDGGVADGGGPDAGTTDGGGDGGGFDGGAPDGGGGDGGGGDGGGGDGGGGGGGGAADGGGDGGSADGGGGDGGTADGGGGGGTADGGGGDGGALVPVDYCHIQWPCSLEGAAGESAEVYLWVYQEGVTDSIGAGSGLRAEVGVGVEGVDPADASWSWASAGWYADKDGLVPGDRANDEMLATLRFPASAGRYDYAGRVSADEGRSWLYCDLAESEDNRCGGSGSRDGFHSDTTGKLTVR